MIELRFANPGDADRLFDWRNDPITLACFRSTAPVPREDHDRWMKFNVESGYGEHIVLIAENGGEPVGVIRFDADRKDIMSYDVSITVAPEHREMGFASKILAHACGLVQDFSLNAEVRHENAASKKVFESCGFATIGSDDRFVTYRKNAS
jgi:RimJ/RimL family protein N-acetyltransferase